jgi:leucine dehydrogenase
MYARLSDRTIDGGRLLGVFETIETEGHESVHYGYDEASGLRVIAAIHSTALGPSLGGTRFYPYKNDHDALFDVLRLAKAMTYKAACAGLDQGGGKAVIIGDPRTLGSDALFRAYGRFVDGLAGRYITAEDVGTTVANMEIVAQETEHVSGLPRETGGSGDPSPATARGVVAGMLGVAQNLWGSDDLQGRKIAIKGVGKVGMSLAERLSQRGCDLVVADVNDEATDHAAVMFGAKVVAVDEIHHVDADIFSPCALGADLNARSIPELSCAAVAGSANNQLLSRSDADLLAERGILYAPDFVVNAGGIINIAAEQGGYTPEKAQSMVDRIQQNLADVFDAASAASTNTERAAVRIADARIAAAQGAES